jgi:antitoxin (DNA-binding transcriptional repressor) of toxin-antitoxin stability system
MKKAKIGELRNNLSRYLEHVRGGGEVLVLDRDRPVARIVAIAAGRSADDGRLARLERRGLVRAGAGGLPTWFGRRKAPKVKGSVLHDLLAERRDGR